MRGDIGPVDVSRPSPAGDHDLVRVAFDLAPSGMLAIDEQGAIVTANREAERLFGWSREELAARPVEMLMPERFRAVHPDLRAGFMRDPHSRPMGAGRELYGLRRDGTEFPIEIGLNPVLIAGGRFVLASVVDITARRKLEEDQRRSQRLETIGIFAGGIAHDFNNILLGIVGHTELALKGSGVADQGREDLENVLKAAERGRQLVQRILTFSRESETARVPLRLDRTVGDAITMLRASLPSTIEIQARLDPATPPVVGDETQVHQVLMNLATNAAHAMPSGGTLVIELRPFTVDAALAAGRGSARAGLHARLTVSDTGAGMTAEVLEHALVPFYTTKPHGQGTGLGLSVVHGIVGGHGGFVEIVSEPGQGTTVTIDLPATDAGVTAEVTTSTVPETGRSLRILFVEDEPALAQMQRRLLEDLDFEVTVHTSGAEALDAFRDRPDAFELLITDETMPGMTGSMLAREILEIRPELPVLIVSGGDRYELRRSLPSGVRHVLRKPYTSKELAAAIREVVRRTASG